MKELAIIALVLFSGLSEAQAGDPDDGYAIVRGDTIFGKIQINFEEGSILIKQDSVNRVFLTDIQQITLWNEKRETYIPIKEDNKTIFYKVLVQGDFPLLQAGELLFTLKEGSVIEIRSEKDLYGLFGKRDVKDYVFLRNIQLAEVGGMVDVFRYFNKEESF